MRPTPYAVTFEYLRRYKTGVKHKGVDFGCPYGSRVGAMRPGTVVHVGLGGWGPAYGLQIIVRCSDGRYEQYAHLSSTAVKAGQTVKAGQRLGLSGGVPKYKGDKRAGNSTGPHLHVQVCTRYVYTAHINPWASINWQPATSPSTPAADELDSSVYSINCWGAHPTDWSKRSKILAREILAADASFVCAQELYAVLRPTLDKLLAGHYAPAITNKGKVVYVRTGRWEAVKGTERKFSLGNGKHAAAVRAKHLASGTLLPVSSGHLSWRPGDFNKRAAETASWISQFNKAYGSTGPAVLAADWNVDRLDGDYAGKTAAGLGFHDAETDVALVGAGEYDTYNDYSRTPPKHGSHIDRVMLRAAKAFGARVDTHDFPYGADHFGFVARFRFKRKASK